MNAPATEWVNPATLTTDPNNPNLMSEEQIIALKKSIETYGWLMPIITNEDGLIADGHQRHRAAIELGLQTVSVIKLPIKEVDRLMLQQVLNKLRGEHRAEMDAKIYEILYNEGRMESLAELLATKQSRLMSLVDRHRVVEEEQFDVDAHLRTVKTKIRQGDLFVLGKHRLLCGDATSENDWNTLMQGEQADMLFTDPPYGVSYGSKNEFLNNHDKGNHIQDDIIDDDLVPEEIYYLWKGFLNSAAKHCNNTSSYYVCSPQGGELMMMMMKAIHESPWSLKHTIIWVKNNHVLGRSDYNYQHEPILYGWKKKGTHKFIKGGEHNKSVWNINKPHKSDLHPTMKPVELVKNAIQNSSVQEQTIIDPFGGSGTTIIAAEQTNRKCYTMEISPKYCQTIIDRWQAITGTKAEKQ